MITQRVARYSDLDFNGHVNNTRYLDWFCDGFDSAYHEKWELYDALIHFNHEITAEQCATLALQQQNGQTVMRGAVEILEDVWQPLRLVISKAVLVLCGVCSNVSVLILLRTRYGWLAILSIVGLVRWKPCAFYEILVQR